MAVILCGYFSEIFAQNDFGPQTDFFNYKAKKEAYFDSNRMVKNGDTSGPPTHITKPDYH